MIDQKLREELHNLADRVEQLGSVSEYSVAIGFDGFVDEIIEVVDKRESFDSFKRLETIEQFGARIQNAAGLSTNIELVPKTVKLGGNGPIMANALVSFGVAVDYVGALGKEAINPVFSEMVEGCRSAVSIADPGHTDALEFSDGKLLLGKLAALNDVNWGRLQEKLGEENIARLLGNEDLVATVNWTMTPYMNGIWEGLLDVLSKKTQEKKPILFVDLADPEKRKNEDVVEAVHLIERFSPYYRVVLGLNRKEASEIAMVMNIGLSDKPQNVTLEEITKQLAGALNLWCLMVHPTHEAAAVCQGEFAHVTGPFTSQPRLTTGAGDNFNAGFCLGLLLELPLTNALMLGKATSGFYVRNMRSPSFNELIAFLRTWADNAGQDF